MPDAIRDFVHFLSVEEENILKSFLNLRDEAFLVVNLDILFQSCLSLQPIDKKELKIPAFLYLNVHREFYLAMASFLRLHLSKSFASLRSSFDSVFTASYLLKNPDKIKIYLSPVSQDQTPEEKKEWGNIFKNIKRTIEINITEYPNFKNLLEAHKLCSVHLHSDALCVMQRYSEDSKDLMLRADYFEYQEQVDDYKKWLGCLLFYFFAIFMIFWNEIFKDRAGDKIKEIEIRIRAYEGKMKEFIVKYPLKK